MNGSVSAVHHRQAALVALCPQHTPQLRQAEVRTTGSPDGAVFVADDASTLWKHDLHSGEIMWSVASVERPTKGIVQLLQRVDDGVVYGCYDGTVTRVDSTSGDIRWRRRIDSSIHATPTIDDAGARLFASATPSSGTRAIRRVIRSAASTWPVGA